MKELFEEHANGLTLAAFLVAAVVSLACEQRPPGAAQGAPGRAHRWAVNGCLFLLGGVVRPGVLAYAQARPSSGNLAVPAALPWIAGFLLLDVAAYTRHVAHHRAPILWRFHRVHHTDADLDWTTSVRFHPFEVVLSAAVDLALVRLLSLPVTVVGAYALTVALWGSLCHANVALPRWLAASLGRVLVTPLVHRAHHSPLLPSTDRNYGVVFSFWDSLFRTRGPEAPLGSRVGLRGFLGARSQTFGASLAAPFLEGSALAAAPLDDQQPPAEQ